MNDRRVNALCRGQILPNDFPDFAGPTFPIPVSLIARLPLSQSSWVAGGGLADHGGNRTLSLNVTRRTKARVHLVKGHVARTAEVPSGAAGLLERLFRHFGQSLPLGGLIAGDAEVGKARCCRVMRPHLILIAAGPSCILRQRAAFVRSASSVSTRSLSTVPRPHASRLTPPECHVLSERAINRTPGDAEALRVAAGPNSARSCLICAASC
jgi:hypothetical protein